MCQLLFERFDVRAHRRRRGVSDQARYHRAKLQYEIDPSDLHAALERGERIIVVDTRPPAIYGRSHIPGASIFRTGRWTPRRPRASIGKH